MTLILDLNELSLYNLNYYLSPVINQLIELWEEIELSATYESSNGISIRVTVICCSYDISAAKKLCDHISACVACYRCIKMAQYNDRDQPNFSGFDDINGWFVEKDINQIWKNVWE